MFCTPKLIFGSTEGIVSRFHVLRSLTRFRLWRALGPVFMSCAPELVFCGFVGVGS
jgi:hypothetical protein